MYRAEVVEMSTSHLRNGDVRVIAAYLKDIPDGESAAHADNATVSVDHTTGRRLYLDHCIGCHMENGQGQRGAFPALKGSAIGQGRNPATEIRLILSGSPAASTPGNPNRFAMPAFAGKLSDREIADQMSYLRQAWGNAADEVSRRDVSGVRRQMGTQAPRLPRN